MPVSLPQLLAARDARAALERDLLAQYARCTLVVLTVVVPGAEKRTEASLLVARAACAALDKLLAAHCRHRLERDLATGFEAYWLVDLPQLEAKRRTVELEDTHPLGRLFDVDIILPEGRPLSRTELGAPPRRCLLCDREARFCMRNGSHTREELHAKIAQMIADYVG